MFGFDLRKIDIKYYEKNFGLGVRRHLLLEKDTTIPEMRRKIRKLWLVHTTIKVMFYTSIAFGFLNVMTRLHFILPQFN